MPQRPSTKRKRLRQVEAWLRLHYHWPTSRPIQIRVEDLGGVAGDNGHCVEDGAGGYILGINKRSSGSEQIHTMLHEWAHANPRRMTHNKAWGLLHQRVYTHWFDKGGSDESKEL